MRVRDDVDHLLRAVIESDGRSDLEREIFGGIEDLAARGRFADLVRFARALEDEPIARAPIRVLQPAFDHVLRALALTRSFEAAEATIAVMEIERARTASPPAQRPRGSLVARMLGQTQTRATCASMVALHHASPALREMLACWVQELVVRGTDCRGVGSIEAMWASLRLTGHVLGALPLHRLAIEEPLGEVLPDVDMRSDLISFVPEALPQEKAPPRAAIELREQAAPIGLAGAFEHWIEEAGAAIEARVLVCVEPMSLVPADVTASMLRRSARTTIADDGRELDRIEASSALGLLFAAAANHGPRGFGRGAGYARHDAWRSFAGLIGGAATDLATLEADAPAASFYWSRREDGWFTTSDHDLRLACLRADGRSLALLAGTAR